MVKKNSFACLPGYGLATDFKVPATRDNLNSIKIDLAQGIQQEPDVVQSKTSVVMDSRGLLSLTIRAKTSDGQELTASASATQNGGVTP